MGTRGPYAKTAQLKAQILDAALARIAEDGWSATSLQQVADAVGMTKPGLLHHFGSRDALLTAVLTRRDERDVSGIVRTGEEDAVEGFLRLVQHNTTVPGLVALFSAVTGIGASERPGSPARAFADGHYPFVLADLRDAFAARQAAGTLRADVDPLSAARWFVAASDGLQTQWLLDPSVDMRGELERLLALLSVPVAPDAATQGAPTVPVARPA